jgi:t-SNARE complex subunit (syntaxin)
MADNDQLLEKIGNLIDQKLEPVKKDLQDVKQSQSRLDQGQAHTNTALEAVKAGQDNIRENMATKADVMNLAAKVDKVLKQHDE